LFGCVALLFGFLAAVSTGLAVDWTTSDDRNGDGRPDIWRTYDRAGHLVEVAVDSNFDGRSDVHEYYTGGDLIRRESDRNFDDRVDLVEEFDTTTHEPVRATIDLDFDGIADVLTLFQDGRPVYSVNASPRQPDRPEDGSTRAARARVGRSPITPLEDPFALDPAVRSQRSPVPAVDVTSTLPAVFQGLQPVEVYAAVLVGVWPVATPQLCGATRAVCAPRGPPC
jgi:hypothetical protein